MLEFNMPKINSKTDGTNGTFTIEPLEKGYGTTLGNALRRVMLSSLPGAAVRYVRLDGVLHEFSTMHGVREDVPEIILAIKGIVAKMNVEESVGYIDYVGPGTVTARDIKCDADIEIINPDLEIASVSDGARFYAELGFSRGRGYVSSEANKQLSPDAPLGTIFVDSIYTPVLKVSYTVENTRVGDLTDLDKLTIEIKTDSSISPNDAMAISSRILIGHFDCISDLSDSAFKPELIPDSETQMTTLLDKTIDELEFSVRSYNCLKREGINTVSDLTALTAQETMKIRNLGQKSYEEIVNKLESMGLSFRVVD